MRALLLIGAALLATPAAAQDYYPPLIPNLSVMATKAEVQAAQATADAACKPMAAVPPTETPGGTPGSGNTCRLADAANNRISRTGTFTVTNGAVLCSGSTTCTWDVPLPAGAASYPVFFTAIGATAAPGVKCKVTSSTNTGFTGAQCVQSVASVSILGASVELAAATGTQVFILSLPATQANR